MVRARTGQTRYRSINQEQSTPALAASEKTANPLCRKALGIYGGWKGVPCHENGDVSGDSPQKILKKPLIFPKGCAIIVM